MQETLIEKVKQLNTIIKKEIASVNYRSISEAKNSIKNYSQLQIVLYLAQHKDDVVHQKDIGKAVNLRKSSITEHLDYLESVDIIKRIDDVVDHRKKRIVLSDKALIIEENFSRTIEKINEKMLIGISEEELDLFIKIVNKIENNLKGDKN